MFEPCKDVPKRTWIFGNMFYGPMTRNLIYVDRMEGLWYRSHPKKSMIQNVLCQQLSMEVVVLKFGNAALSMMLETWSLLIVI